MGRLRHLSRSNMTKTRVWKKTRWGVGFPGGAKHSFGVLFLCLIAVNFQAHDSPSAFNLFAVFLDRFVFGIVGGSQGRKRREQGANKQGLERESRMSCIPETEDRRAIRVLKVVAQMPPPVPLS